MFTKIHRAPVEGERTALVVRCGAWGDMIWASAVVKRLKDDGYHVTLHTTDRGYQVVRYDPNIDRFMVTLDGELNLQELDVFWKILSKKFDKVVNLTGSIEGVLLVTPTTEDTLTGENMYNWPQSRLHNQCNVNYMDRTLEIAGYPDAKGMSGQLFFTEKEEKWAQKFRDDHPGFLIVWSLGGSSAHKAYPYAHIVADELMKLYPDIQIVTVGDTWCKLLEFDNPRALRRAGEFGIRKSLVLTKYADLVIGPESSVINAASCFDTPKVLLLSHASIENLSKYWTNTINLFSNVACYPCHKLHYTNDCPKLGDTNIPVCMGKLPPDQLLEAVEKFYGAWKSKQPVGVH